MIILISMVRFGKREAVFFGLFICSAFLIFLASAYGGSEPSVVGHSAGEIEGGSVPSGAVMSFNLASCPAGWSPYSSAVNRMVIGSGSSYALGASGGEATHVLTVAEMPSHGHSISGPWAAWGSGGIHLSSGSAQPFGSSSAVANPTGGNGAHNNIPPYVALLYCEKD